MTLYEDVFAFEANRDVCRDVKSTQGDFTPLRSADPDQSLRCQLHCVLIQTVDGRLHLLTAFDSILSDTLSIGFQLFLHHIE